MASPLELISDQESKLKTLEHDLHLKQLQINRLLNITQAINENVSSEGLFNMYANLLSWEFGITCMALYFRQERGWKCQASIGLSDEEKAHDPSAHFDVFDGQINTLGPQEDPVLKRFSVVAPVLHKQQALAFVFLGDVMDSPEMYDRIQFVRTITNVVAVAIENKRLFKRQLKQERYQTELALATDIQRALMPDKLPKNAYFDMSAIYIPRFGVSGDFYSALVSDDGKLLFCIADISGKGTGAALLMSNFEASFWTLANTRTTMDLLVRDLNDSLFRVTKGERFMTLFIGEYCPKTRKLSYVNAGHNPPLLSYPQEGEILYKVEECIEGCTFIGAFEELPKFQTGKMVLPKGAQILCYTDGVTELFSPSKEMYGEERLMQFAATNSARSPESFNNTLLEELRVFQGFAEATDDVTMLSIRFF